METPVVFKCRRQQLVGMLHFPAGRHPKAGWPAVVFLHGLYGTKTESHRLFVKMARALQAAGVAVLRFDFRGAGDSAGDFSQTTISSELEDAAAALDLMRQRPEVDAARVGLLGFSLGGAVAAVQAAGDPGIKAMVLWAAALDFARLSGRLLTPDAERQIHEMGFFDRGGWQVGQDLAAEIRQFRPLDAAPRVAAPTLLVHGTGDQVVPASDSGAMAAALDAAGRPGRVHFIPNADHTFAALPWEMELLAVTLRWFQLGL